MVKCFKSSNLFWLETDINNFVRENSVVLTQVSYNVHKEICCEENLTIFTAMVLYKKIEA